LEVSIIHNVHADVIAIFGAPLPVVTVRRSILRVNPYLSNGEDSGVKFGEPQWQRFLEWNVTGNL
jgi:hypothetical protein